MAATVAGDFYEERYIRCSRDLSVGVGQPAEKRIQDRMVEERRHDAWTIGGEADLLLMVPALGEFAGVIEPDE